MYEYVYMCMCMNMHMCTQIYQRRYSENVPLESLRAILFQ